jgi:serine/threonine protein kinase
MADWIGKTIGKVSIQKMLGRGGMAEVYLGYHTTLGQPVAVKVMLSYLEDQPEVKTRFEREARVVSTLRHPNIVKIFDLDVADGQPYLVMEYINGPTLSSYLRSLHKKGEQLPAETVEKLVSQLASALDYAHSQGIVHRDIKPANVLLSSQSPILEGEPLPADTQAILTDFGLVRLVDSSVHTTTGTVSGTPAYMSPEQARGEKVDARSDIYSLGVMLYEMMSGRVPFDSDTTMGILLKHMSEAPPPIIGLSISLQVIIDRVLAKDPALRYATAGELARELEYANDGKNLSQASIKAAKAARKAELPNFQPKKSSSWRWLYMGISVAAGVALGLLASQMLIRPPGPTAPPPDPVITASPTPEPTEDPNLPLGRASFSDFNDVMDRMILDVINIPLPEPGTRYEAWLIGPETRRSIGIIQFEPSGQGRLTFLDSQSRNIYGLFSALEITAEPDPDPNPNPSGQILYSSMLPAQASEHVRHLLSTFDGAPNKTALIQGLWYTSDGIATSAKEMQEAYKAGDEALMRKKAEEIINQIVGSQSPDQFQDWDGDGAIDNPGDGFGLLANGEQLGYIQAVTSHADFAARAPDSTLNIRTHAGHVEICSQNIEQWAVELLQVSLQIKDMPFDSQMETSVNKAFELAKFLVSGHDSNGNELIEAVPGEGGADTAYEHAYYMADMLIFAGPERFPPTMEPMPAGEASMPGATPSADPDYPPPPKP